MIETVINSLQTDQVELFLIFFQVILFSFIVLLLFLEKQKEDRKELNYLLYAFIISTISKIILFYLQIRSILLQTSFDSFDTIILVNSVLETFALILLIKAFIIPLYQQKTYSPGIRINIKLNFILLIIAFISIYFLTVYGFSNHQNNFIFADLFFSVWKMIILVIGFILLIQPKYKFKIITLLGVILLLTASILHIYNSLFAKNMITNLNLIDLLLGSLSYPLFGIIIYLGVNSKISKSMQILEAVNKELREIDLKKDIYAGQLKEKKKEIEGIINCMSEGVIVTNNDDKIIYFNPATKRIFDNKNQMLGTNLSNFIKRHKLSELFQQAYKTNQVVQKEIRIPISNKILKANVTVLRDENNKIKGCITVLEDITKLKEVDEMKSEFISIVSHELRTPLTSIKGYASLLLHEKLGKVDDKQKQCLQIIDSESNRLTNLINDVLDLSKMESGKMQLKREFMDIKNTYDKVIIQNLAKEKNIAIIPQFPKKLPKIYADQEKILQVFTNLLSNAIKFTPDGGKIFIRAEVAGNYVVIHIQDTGIGIPEKDLNNLFNKFYQVENHMTRRQGGTGLGLAIVKEIINLHSGIIAVQSEENKGTTFSFAIPTVQYQKTYPVKCWETRMCKNLDCKQCGAVDLKCWLTMGTKCDKSQSIIDKINTCKNCEVYTRNLEKRKKIFKRDESYAAPGYSNPSQIVTDSNQQTALSKTIEPNIEKPDENIQNSKLENTN